MSTPRFAVRKFYDADDEDRYSLMQFVPFDDLWVDVATAPALHSAYDLCEKLNAAVKAEAENDTLRTAVAFMVDELCTHPSYQGTDPVELLDRFMQLARGDED